MKSIETITILLPLRLGKKIQLIAKEEQRTESELIREVLRRYLAQRNLNILVRNGMKTARRKELKRAVR